MSLAVWFSLWRCGRPAGIESMRMSHSTALAAPLRQPGWKLLGFGLVAGAALVVLYLFARFDPSEHSFFPRCLFHTLSGLDCPGCGGQRALHQLLHGHLNLALQSNALFVCLLPLGAWVGCSSLLQALLGIRLPRFFAHHLWPWALCGLVIGFAIARNLPGCDWLRP